MIWILVFVAPVAVATAIAVLSGIGSGTAVAARGVLTRLAWVATLPAALAVLVDDGSRHEVGWMLLGTSVRLDGVGAPLVLLAVAVYALALGFVPDSRAERPHVLAAFMLLCFTGNVAVFAAADLVTFYLAFAAMSFLGYAVVVHDRTRGARRAGAIYLVLTVVGECAVLAAFILVAAGGAMTVDEAPAAVAASDSSGVIILFLIIGFGVKAGTVPLHVWLPLAHPAAPSPASAVLSGVMLKAGIIGWLRFLPLGEGAGEPVWGGVLLALGLVGGLLAVPAGVLQDNPKVILAYSSISQMGFIAALVGAALVAPDLAEACVFAAVVYSVSHGLVKGTLFLGVQAWDTERLPRGIVAGAMGVACVALIGAPLTSGFVAKYAAKEAVGDVGTLVLGIEVAEVLPWFGVGSTLLLARFAVVLVRKDRAGRRTPVARGVVWAALAVGAVVPVAALAGRSSPPLTLPGWVDPAAVWAQTWPLVLGLAAASATFWISRRWAPRESSLWHPRGDIVPAGDIVVWEERAAGALLGATRVASNALGGARNALLGRAARWPSPMPAAERAQRAVGTWVGSGVALIIVLATALWAVLATQGGGA